MPDGMIDTAASDETRRELQAVSEAREDVRTGRLVSAQAVRNWVNSLGTADELLPPRSS